MLRRVAVLTFVAVCAVASFWCGAVGGDVDRRVRLPAALPADLPLPAGALLRSARDLGSDGLTLVFETEEPAAAVEAVLRSRLVAGGWALLSEAVVESAIYFSYRNQGRSVALGISRTGDVTVVGLAYFRPEPNGEGVRG